jgi:N-acetylglucosaminyldiphosphoundecaprenol N-acetyl-beta-D-mannosaminyltransferase
MPTTAVDNTDVAARPTALVLHAPIDVIDWDTTLARICGWAIRRESRYVCICNAHSVVTATQDSRFRDVLRQADMATPDGAPVAWMMRRLGHPDQQRINGPDLMLRCCERAAANSTGIYLLGSTDDKLAALQTRLASIWPTLRISGTHSPPFRPLSAEEDHALVARLNESGAGIVFVSLGCPKQEQWMAEHRGRVQAVMIGVGAAFDFHSGTLSRAPAWMQHHGLEWLHRLLSEPRRLWRRYLVTNTLFIVGAARQLLGSR